MTLSKNIVLTIIIVLGFNSLLIAQTTISQINSSGSSFEKEMHDIYSKLLKKNKITGASIAIVDNGEIVFSSGFGFADKSASVLADANTVYRIGSLTKSFTALCILHLMNNNKININDPVGMYIPELNVISRFNDSNKLYINELISHTSGLRGDLLNGFFCDNPPDFDWTSNTLNQYHTAFPRNYIFSYSNVAYSILGEIIERVSGLSYEDYLKKYIFAPLEMNSSFVYIPQNDSLTKSKGYYKQQEIAEPLIRDYAAGLIHSNVNDLAKYLVFLMGTDSLSSNNIIQQDILDLMFENQLDRLELNQNIKYGLGFMIKDMYIKNDQEVIPATIISHGGNTIVYHTDFGFIPEMKIGAIVLTNSENGPKFNEISTLLEHYIKLAYNMELIHTYELDKEKTARTVEMQEATDYQGIYNTGVNLIMVDDLKKIKFKQENLNLSLKQNKKQPNQYKLRISLLGIPLRIPNTAFQFVEKNSITYLGILNKKTGDFQYIASKDTSDSDAKLWENYFGDYFMVSDYYACSKCNIFNLDFSGLELSLREQDNYLNLEMRFNSEKANFYYMPLDSVTAVCGGIGRGMGESIHIIDNGNLIFNGFEFKKQE